MISLLLPTRGRRKEFLRFMQSAYDTASNPGGIEIVARIDDDDSSYDDLLANLPQVKWITAPRDVLSKCWNDCYAQSEGDILGHLGDDIVFRTRGWDTVIENEFNKYPDRILFAYGDDGGPEFGKISGTHGFISREWVETVGHFVPPYFSSDWNDKWLNDVGEAIGRKKYIDILTEHMHFVHNKGPKDQTHLDRLERGKRDNVEQLYLDKTPEREDDIKKLQAVIDSFARVVS